MTALKIKAKIGAHVSIAGGVFMAPGRAKDEGCETFQCFTRSPQGGPAPELTPVIIDKFKEEMIRCGMDTFYIHAPYYINLASLANNIRHGSISVLRSELERGSLLGARYVMAHLGSSKGQDVKQAIEKVSQGIEKILDGYNGSTKFLIEIAAGSGDVIGHTFEEIAEIMEASVKAPGFGGVCFDTCHAFASGYDFRTPQKAKEMLASFDKIVGLQWLKMTQVNDSMVDVGLKRDRHEHIGDGFIKEEGIASILQTPEFLGFDWLLETEMEGRKKDIEILKNIRQDA